MAPSITDEARSVGLRRQELSLADVDRRRIQLWILALLVVASSAVLGTVVSEELPGVLATTPLWLLRLALALLAIGFFMYVMEKEFQLRRLQAMLIDERVLAIAYARRAAELESLVSASHAVNESLALADVLDALLAGAIDVVDGADGAVMLVEEMPTAQGSSPILRAAAVRGERRVTGETAGLESGYVGLAACTRVPQRAEVDGELPGRLFVPLVHREELLGVLEIGATAGEEFDDHSLRLLGVFAEYVSVSVANARLYEAQRERVAELTELDELKSEFLATVSHELKTPLTSIIGSVSTIRRAAPTAAEREQLLGTAERQAQRLASLVDQLLVAGRLEDRRPSGDAASDLAAVACTVVEDFESTGRPVIRTLPRECVVAVDSEGLQHVLWNLLDNAHKYGSEPVELRVDVRGEMAILSVVDGGDGVPPEARERVFERFCRLDADGGRSGMGLGLPIVREVAEASGGRVWVDDAPGGGAAFRVAIPLAGGDGHRAAGAPRSGTVSAAQAG